MNSTGDQHPFSSCPLSGHCQRQLSLPSGSQGDLHVKLVRSCTLEVTSQEYLVSWLLLQVQMEALFTGIQKDHL